MSRKQILKLINLGFGGTYEITEGDIKALLIIKRVTADGDDIYIRAARDGALSVHRVLKHAIQ